MFPLDSAIRKFTEEISLLQWKSSEPRHSTLEVLFPITFLNISVSSFQKSDGLVQYGRAPAIPQTTINLTCFPGNFTLNSPPSDPTNMIPKFPPFQLKIGGPPLKGWFTTIQFPLPCGEVTALEPDLIKKRPDSCGTPTQDCN